jgi:hypothetical protein
VRLDPSFHGQRLTISVQTLGEATKFSVQIWKLAGGEATPRAITHQPETISEHHDGTHAFTIPEVDTSAYNRLALIIARLDPD